MSFKKIYSDRKLLYDAIKQNKTGVLKIVTELYSESTHFIYEILQNAEDAGATSISFSLFSKKIVINHNGRPFEIKDIGGITNIAEENSDKINDNDKIGKFGIGFKSVYAITNMPQIQSGLYDFQIKDFLLPILLSDNNIFEDTCIILPFYNNHKTTDEIYELLVNKLEKLEYFNLLFLKNLKEIKIEIEKTIRVISKEEHIVSSKKTNLAYECNIIDDGIPHHYLHFKKEVKHPSFTALNNKPKLSIAFKQDFIEGVPIISFSESSKLFVFFETGYETFLKFMIHAPFNTTPSRDNINFQEQINIELLDELIELFKDVLEYFCTNKLIDVNLLNHLPLDSSRNKNEIIYQKFYETLKAEFLSEKKYLPANDGNLLASASKVGLIRGRELKNILNAKNDLQKLFKIDYWLNAEITIDKAPELRSYLMKELSIKEYGPEEFARVVTKEFFESKTNNWIRSFYSFLNGKQQSLYSAGKEGVLRKKPFIRLSSGKHTEPFDLNGKPKVFLPVAKKKIPYDIIHPDVISSKFSLEFIKDKLGINEPNLLDEIRSHIIPLYIEGASKFPTNKIHLKHMEFVLDVYVNGKDNIKAEIIEMLCFENVYFFKVLEFNTFKNYWGRGDICYLRSEKLEKYFRYISGVYFFDTEFYSSLPIDLLNQILLKCGFKINVRLSTFDPGFTEEKKRLLRLNSFFKSDEITWYQPWSVEDHTLKGFKDIFHSSPLTQDDSVLLWQILIDFIKLDEKKDDLFRGIYWWFRSNDRSATFVSQILFDLRSTKWLFNKENSLCRPNEITLGNLSQDYEIVTEEAKYLIEKLQFKTEAEQEYLNQIPIEKRNELLEAAELIRLSKETGIDYKTMLQQKIGEEKRAVYEAELESAPPVEEVDAEEIPFEGFDNSIVDVGENGDKSETQEGDDRNVKGDTKSSNQNLLPQDIKNKIGYRGERVVWLALKKKWAKKYVLERETNEEMEFANPDGENFVLLHLNDSNRKGYGCDILIKVGEDIQKYIEVKSTKSKGKEYYSVSGFQWALAHKNYSQSVGNKYCIYIVTDVLNDKPSITLIENPIKKWKEGKLRANPVNIEF